MMVGEEELHGCYRKERVRIEGGALTGIVAVRPCVDARDIVFFQELQRILAPVVRRVVPENDVVASPLGRPLV